MSECQNFEVRDRLPEYVHGAIEDDAELALIRSHVELCGDCARELSVIEAMLASAPAPAVDVARIVAAIPAYRAVGVAPVMAASVGRTGALPKAQRRWFGGLNGTYFRVAAGFLIAAAGLSAVVVTRRPATVAPVVTGATGTGVALVNVSDLSDDNLERLIQSMGDLDDAPPTEPEAVTPTMSGGAI